MEMVKRQLSSCNNKILLWLSGLLSSLTKGVVTFLFLIIAFSLISRRLKETYMVCKT